MIDDKSTSSFIGTCGFQSINGHRAEIGVEIGTEHWGKGIALEVIDSLIMYGFSNLRLHRLQAFVCKNNTRSVRLFDRLGFQREGVLRDYIYLNHRNVTESVFVYSKLNTDCCESTQISRY